MRETLRRVLVRKQADRDEIASQLMRYRDRRGDDWGDIIDMPTMHPDARRRVVRIVGELEANAHDGPPQEMGSACWSPRRSQSPMDSLPSS